MIGRLIEKLQRAGLILSEAEIAAFAEEESLLDDEDIADAIWLALQMGVIEGDLAKTDEETPGQEDEGDRPLKVIEDTSPADPPPTASIVFPNTQSSSTEEAEKPSEKGFPIQVEAAPALPDRLSIGRSLRPFMRKERSQRNQELDEIATVDRIAEHQVWIPVMQPACERWLELELVIEASELSFIWEDTLQEFRQVLERQGAFRNVRCWWLEGTEQGKLNLVSKRTEASAISPRPCSPKELLDPAGRRVVLMVSDCRSPVWKSGSIHSLLKRWSQQQPTAILQLLPERLWSQSELDVGVGVQVSSLTPAAPGPKLRIKPGAGSREFDSPNVLTIPIVTLTAKSLKQWGLVIASVGHERSPARWFDLGWVTDPERDRTITVVEPDSAEDRLELFYATASPIAQRLAEMMAAASVRLSVVRLIQKELLPEAKPIHVAEVFDSGLIFSRPSEDGIAYDFAPGVRRLLNERTDLEDTTRVLDTLGGAIAEQLGLPQIRSFTALLSPRASWDQDVQATILPFAQITTEVLHNLGGDYAALAEIVEEEARMKSNWIRPVREADLAAEEQEDEQGEFPPLKLLEFEIVQLLEREELPEFPEIRVQEVEVVTIVFEELPPIGELELFEFEVATLEQNIQEQRTGFLQNLFRQRQSEWVIRKRKAQAYQWMELLSDRLQLEMVAIPSGRFLMGSPESELERSPSEGPQREVTVGEFLMSRYPITQVQWSFVARLPKVNRELESSPSSFKGNNLPVERVFWYYAVEFCDRLSRYTDHQYRLPTEAEWEYACRAGTTTPFHFGETIMTDLANYRGTDDKQYNWSGSYGQGPKGNYREKTTPVDQFKIANAFGLCDMHGNVWEWCLDHWHNDYKGAPTDGSAWVVEEGGRARVIRGGSWFDDPRDCRSAFRNSPDPDDRNYRLGFRVVCEVP